MTFRCSIASAEDSEPLGGTAPTEVRYLLVEDPGPWTAKAVEGSGLPDEVKRHLASLEDTRVQLVRRHGGSDVRDGRRVFTVDFGDGAPRVGTTMVTDDRELLEPLSTTPYDGLLWLVCTNGRRDVCCAEFGRPVARANSPAACTFGPMEPAANGSDSSASG